jgi:hypothetical protein
MGKLGWVHGVAGVTYPPELLRVPECPGSDQVQAISLNNGDLDQERHLFSTGQKAPLLVGDDPSVIVHNAGILQGCIAAFAIKHNSPHLEASRY